MTAPTMAEDDLLVRVAAEAHGVDLGRGARRVVAALVYYPAWLVGASVSGLAWCVAAWRVGYRDGRRRPTESAG